MMDVTLHNGTTVPCDDRPFGSGADGAVHWTTDGRHLVKFYHNPEPWRAPGLDAILTRFNVVQGESYWEALLCWPVGVVRTPRLGVLLPRAAAGLKAVKFFLGPKWLKYHPEDLGTFHGRLGVALRLARGVRRLHFRGLCHSDLSENNVFANVQDGRSYIIDCDGLVVPNLPYARAVVRGTPKYMAPELASGKVETPSVEADLHALAVLIYQLLLLRHPLLGQKIHDPHDADRNEALALGERALYIEHPSDASNRPQHLDFPADLLGIQVNRLLHTVFVTGLQQPTQRPAAAAWERDLVRLMDTVVSCANANCLLKTFPFPEISGSTARVACPWCKTPFRGMRLPVLRWCNPVSGQVGLYRPDGTRIVVREDTTLHQWHVRPNTLPGPDVELRPLAHFARWHDRGGAERWGLVNSGLSFLEAADGGATWRRIRLNETVELRPQRTLRFGPVGTEARVALIEVPQLV